MQLRLKDIVLDAVFPKTCLGCGKEGKYICEKCDLFISEAPDIFLGGDLVQVFSAWEYEGLVKKAILGIKYGHAYDIINELVEKTLKIKELDFPENVVITFVPLFRKKEKERGFNQAEVIARKLGKELGIKVFTLLEKIKDTKSQTKLDRQERLDNIRGAFRLRSGQAMSVGHRLPDILLVDDVWTSGATMRECAKVLKKAGAKNILGFTLARTI